MIILPCLAPYLIAVERLNKLALSAASRNVRPINERCFSVENVFSFAPWVERNAGRFDLLAQTLQTIDRSDGVTIRTLAEADYLLPKSLGSLPRSGTRVNAIQEQIVIELRASGWGNPTAGFGDMGALEVAVEWRLWSHESAHNWLEKIKDASALFDGLADDGCDVRPNLERFLSRARPKKLEKFS